MGIGVSVAGIFVSVALGCFLALQAAYRGGARRVVTRSAALIAGGGAAFWVLSIGTLDVDNPDLWSDLRIALLRDAAIAAGLAWFVAGSFESGVRRAGEKLEKKGKHG